MGDYIYAISHGGITVTHLDSLDQSDSHQFEYAHHYGEEIESDEEEDVAVESSK